MSSNTTLNVSAPAPKSPEIKPPAAPAVMGMRKGFLFADTRAVSTSIKVTSPPPVTAAKVDKLQFQNAEKQTQFVSALLEEFKRHGGWISKTFRYTPEQTEGFLSQPTVILGVLSEQLKEYREIRYLDFLVKLQKHYPRAFLTAVLPDHAPSAPWIHQVEAHPFEAKDSLMQLQEVLKGKATFLTFLTAHPGTYPLSLLEELLKPGCVFDLHLGWALFYHQHELLDLICKYLPEDHFKDPRAASGSFMYCLYYENWMALDKLFATGLDLSQAKPHFEEAVKEGQLPFVQKLLEHGFQIT